MSIAVARAALTVWSKMRVLGSSGRSQTCRNYGHFCNVLPSDQLHLAARAIRRERNALSEKLALGKWYVHKGETMVKATRSGTGSVLASLFAGLALTDGISHSAVAGETIKFHSQHINVGTKWDATELGDEPGHISATFAAKGVGLRRVGPPEPPYKGDARERVGAKRSAFLVAASVAQRRE